MVEMLHFVQHDMTKVVNVNNYGFWKRVVPRNLQYQAEMISSPIAIE
jgi:hypothetical protein